MARTKSNAKLSPKAVAQTQTWRDVKTSFLVVSILINAFILVGWAVLKLTTQYDASLATTLLGR